MISADPLDRGPPWKRASRQEMRLIVKFPKRPWRRSRAFRSAPLAPSTLNLPKNVSRGVRPCGVSAEAAFNGSLLHGMVFGMATTKITITLEDQQLEEIRALVAARAAASVSEFVKHAVGVDLFDAAGWREMLEDALQQTGGPLRRKERAWADALLFPHGQKRVSRKGKAA